jgi:hypothetical protein
MRTLGRYADFTAPQEHNLKAFVTEFGGSNTTECYTALQGFLDYMANNPEYIGWTAWAAGRTATSAQILRRRH